MKNKKNWLMISAIFLNIAAYCQMTVTGTAYTEIVPLVSAKESVQLNFGRFSPVEGDGTITISPEGTRMASGSVLLLDGPFNQGAIIITGPESNSMSILLPTTPQILSHTNSINTLYLDRWTCNIPKNKNDNRIITIGATLNFKSIEANPAGLYSGSYQIIFFYN